MIRKRQEDEEGWIEVLISDWHAISFKYNTKEHYKDVLFDSVFEDALNPSSKQFFIKIINPDLEVDILRFLIRIFSKDHTIEKLRSNYADQFVRYKDEKLKDENNYNIHLNFEISFYTMIVDTLLDNTIS